MMPWLRRSLPCLAAILAAVLTAASVVALPDSEVAGLEAPDGRGRDSFGWSVAVDGDTAVVGSVLADPDNKTNAGAAYVFERGQSGWTMRAKLTPTDADGGDEFGRSVDISGDTIVVGASSKSGEPNHLGVPTHPGAAYVFVRDEANWSQQAKLEADDATSSDEFGWSVAISGNTAMVGATDVRDALGSKVGAVYVFGRADGVWAQQAKLTADDASTDDDFGYALSLGPSTALIGISRIGSGAVYVFGYNGVAWNQQTKLTAPDPVAGDRFGSSVGVDGDTAIVGAPRDEDAGPRSGAAYVYTNSVGAWRLQAKLVAEDAGAERDFGAFVAISGDTAVVGAPIGRPGAAYVFTRSDSDWSQRAKLTASDAENDDRFGVSAAIDNETVVVGAYRSNPFRGLRGAAYVFESGPLSSGPQPPEEEGSTDALALVAGTNLIGWTGAPTTSTALIDADPAIDAIWVWDGRQWVGDARALPATLRPTLSIRPGDGLFIITSAETVLDPGPTPAGASTALPTSGTALVGWIGAPTTTAASWTPTRRSARSGCGTPPPRPGSGTRARCPDRCAQTSWSVGGWGSS